MLPNYRDMMVVMFCTGELLPVGFNARMLLEIELCMLHNFLPMAFVYFVFSDRLVDLFVCIQKKKRL